MRRRAFTLLEIIVVLAILVVICAAVWTALSHLGTTEKTTDREATRALLQARLAEMLQRDLRSAADPVISRDREFEIHRYVLEGDRLEVRTVIWKKSDAFKITRTLGKDKPQEFDFRGLLKPESLGVDIRMEKLGDVMFNAP
jgi:prepilin-type N-terminal cleavage/methylation domain-containing protein